MEKSDFGLESSEWAMSNWEEVSREDLDLAPFSVVINVLEDGTE